MCEAGLVGRMKVRQWFGFGKIRVAIILKVKVVAARGAPWVFGSLINVGIVPGLSCHPQSS